METRANIDATRIFVTGISNGGSMTMRMACEAADLVRAAASVSFPLNTDQCSPAKPIGVTEIAGTADTTVPYDGGDFLQLGTVGGLLEHPLRRAERTCEPCGMESDRRLQRQHGPDVSARQLVRAGLFAMRG